MLCNVEGHRTIGHIESVKMCRPLSSAYSVFWANSLDIWAVSAFLLFQEQQRAGCRASVNITNGPMVCSKVRHVERAECYVFLHLNVSSRPIIQEHTQKLNLLPHQYPVPKLVFSQRTISISISMSSLQQGENIVTSAQ
jgi:hypothetical protein